MHGGANNLMDPNLKKNNVTAFAFLIVPIALLVISIFLLRMDSLIGYSAGIVLLSVFFTQTFILLHECGHLSYFENRTLNVIFGNVFGVLTGIPYYTWVHMHRLHHKWTGWRDRDPTTESTVQPSNGTLTRYVVNICWWLFIPIFFTAYMLSNYWNIGKLKRFLPAAVFKVAVVHIVLQLLFYAAVCYVYPTVILHAVLPAFLLSMVWKELLIMTQHSHIEIPVSDGEDVKPISYMEQVAYTRSFYTSRFIAKYVLFHFNLHEAHHAHPGIPAYRLDKIDLHLPQEPTYSEWLLQAKGMKGEDYIFRTSKHTGKRF